MILGVYAHTAARTVAAPATTATAAIYARADRLAPSRVTKVVAQKVYTASGAQNRIAGIINGTNGPIGCFEPTRTIPEIIQTEPISIDVGPQSPFPLTFKACCVPTQLRLLDSEEQLPRMNLTKVPDWVADQLRGYFFGWARFDAPYSKASLTGAWCPAILSVRGLDPLQVARVNLAQIAKRVVALRVLDDIPLQTDKVEVRVLGYLRAEIPPPVGSTSKQLAEAQAAAAEAAMLADAYDAFVVHETLAHPAWGADYTTLQPKQDSSWIDRTQEGLAGLLSRGQKLVEQVPLHKVGVRSAADEIRESQISVNGFYIVR